jgi:3-hydroxybutyryl-CoA dehydratase
MSGPLPTELIGRQVSFRKTVSESDVYGFAGVTGDFAPNHVDEQFMAGTRFGGRIAHGVLLLGYTSTASTRMVELIGGQAVSVGYDRVRFTAPVRLGDTITVHYTLARLDQAKRRAYSDIDVINQHDIVCLVATHVLAFVD